MHSDGVRRVRTARHRSRTGFNARCRKVLHDMLELLAGLAAVVLFGVLTGAGFGLGLALIGVWM